MKEHLREFYALAEGITSAADFSMKIDNALGELKELIAKAAPATERPLRIVHTGGKTTKRGDGGESTLDNTSLKMFRTQ